MISVLGRGGFGTVYRADLLGEGSFVRPVALKVLNPEMEGVATVAARLRDEARLLGRIRHRSIVQVDGLVKLDDRWTVVMEFVDGIDLAKVIEAGAVPARAALEIIGEVAGALYVAQTWPGDDGRPLGLLHRDIKPANLLLTAAGEVKVLDFGVARAETSDREAQTSGMRFGSPGYVAPERVDGEELPAGDIYSLGVVAYEILAGSKLGRPSVRKDRHDPYIAEMLAHLARSQPPEVMALLGKLLSYEPRERPSSRDLERQCREIVSALPGPFLRDWSEAALPPLLAARAMPSAREDFSADVLTEGTTSAQNTSVFPDVDPPSKPEASSVLEAPIHVPVQLPPMQGRGILGTLADISFVTAIAVGTASVLVVAAMTGCFFIVCMGL